MPSLYVHIGPYKTGTTSFQNYMWKNREALKKKGFLYPETGIQFTGSGRRHFSLAKAPRGFKEKQQFEALWDDLFSEISSSKGIQKVLISAERFSWCMDLLAKRKIQMEQYSPKLVVVVRDEMALSRSMYFQIVKKRFKSRNKIQAIGLENIDKWFDKHKANFSYPQILQPWIQNFGIESVIFVPFEESRETDIVTSLLTAVGVPSVISDYKRIRANPSIGFLATNAAIIDSKISPKRARRAMLLGAKIERKFPFLKDIPLEHYNWKKMHAYFASENALAFKKYPSFKQVYKLISRPKRSNSGFFFRVDNLPFKWAGLFARKFTKVNK